MPVERVEFEVRMQPSGGRFTAPTDQPVLRSALEAGLNVPSSCRNGTCRACLKPLLGGQVHYRIAWPGLLPEEKQSGAWLLPCVAYPLTDLVIGD